VQHLGKFSIRKFGFFLIMNYRPKKSLENLIPNSTDESIDLLRRLLQFNPDKRITAEDGLRHSFVASYVFLFNMNFFDLFIII
jgi:serine/threonine protein kinase